MSPKLYTDANPSTVAYVLEDGGSGYTNLPPGYTSMEAEYIAILYGLNEYYNRWSKELDTRQEDMDIERYIRTGQVEFAPVSDLAARTKRQLPPPVLVLCDNEVVVNQLNRRYHIGNERLRKLAQQIWQMTKNVEVAFAWISREDNIAGKMLK